MDIPFIDLPWDNTAFLVHVFAAIAMSLRLIYRRLNTTVTLAWMLVVIFLPVIGLVLYWLFGSRKLSRRRQNVGQRIRDHYLKTYRLTDDAVDPHDIHTTPHFEDLAHAVEAMTGFAPIAGNRIELIDDDEAIFDAMVADIQNAETSVYAEFYIIDPQGMVLPVLEALEGAARRGVDVKLLADAFGSRPYLKSNWPQRLERAGVDIATSLQVGPLKSISKRTDMRNHRKILVVDQKIGYIGSCNLTDPELFKPEDGVWVDLMARVEGPFAESLSVVLAADFIYDDIGSDFKPNDLKAFPTETIHPNRKGPAVAQLVPSGPEMKQNVIYETIVSAIFSATDRIRIVTPYFVPDDAVLLALCNAARRGVSVELIVPADGDSIMVTYASSAAFETLLEAGVRIGKYNGGMLHTKAFVLDEDVSLVGTVNMDMRSFHLNLEVTMIVYDEDFNDALDSVVQSYADDCDWMDLDQWSRRSEAQRFKENVFRLVSPLL